MRNLLLTTIYLIICSILKYTKKKNSCRISNPCFWKKKKKSTTWSSVFIQSSFVSLTWEYILCLNFPKVNSFLPLSVWLCCSFINKAQFIYFRLYSNLGFFPVLIDLLPFVDYVKHKHGSKYQSCTGGILRRRLSSWFLSFPSRPSTISYR